MLCHSLHSCEAREEKGNLGHPSVFQLQPCQFCDPSCQIGLFVQGLLCAEWTECCVMGCMQTNPQQSMGCVSSLSSGLYELFAVSWLVIQLS